MQKKFTRIMACLLVLVMIVGILAALPASAEEPAMNITANLGFADADWNPQDWGETANTVVTGAGTYTITYNAPSAFSGVTVFVVDLVSGLEAITNAGLSLTDLKIAVDGKDVPVDMTKVVTGDIEEKGNFRIEIYNEWGNTKANCPIDTTLLEGTTLEVTFTLGTAEGGDEPAEPTMNITANLGFADADWNPQDWGETANTVVTGAGTYTITYNAPSAFSGAMVFVVDLVGGLEPITNAGLSLTDLKIAVDGNEIAVDMTKVITGDIEEKGNFRIEIYNEWGNTKANCPIDTTLLEGTKLDVIFTLSAAPAEPTMDIVANLGFADADWDPQDWGETANTQVTGAGTYTITYNAPSAFSGAMVFVVDLVGGLEPITNAGLGLTDLKLAIDGNEIAVDMTKVVTGDIEEKGNFRIEIYNEWGNTKANCPIDTTLLEGTKLEVIFTLGAAEGGTDTPVEPEPEPEPEPIPEFDPAGSYNAYLLLQTPNWTYRNAWNDTNGGLGSEYWGNYIYGNETSLTYGVVTDAVVAGNGTYSVMITDFGTIFADDFATAGQDYFNILGVSTDIPLSDDLVITDVHLVIDGKTKVKYAEAYLDPDDTGYVKILVQNIWNADVASTSYYPVPEESLEIRFTIKSGFNYDKAGSEETDPTTPATTPATQPGGSDAQQPSSPVIPIIIAVVVVAAVVVVIIVLKKKKAQ